MANHKSAWKRIRQNTKRHERNIHFKTIVRNRVRSVREAVKAGETGTAQQTLVKAISAIDQVASKGVLHHNTAARKISRLSKLVHKMMSTPVNE